MEGDRPPFSVGDVVDGRYRIKREIARGGMSVVHEAEHVHLGTRVVLKSLAGHPREHAEAEPRLLREGRALALARHPSVVEVLDAGRDERGRVYLVLAMIEGRSLDGLLAARGRLDVPTALAVATRLCEVLEHVHARGVIHRDVKPSNIMIGRDATGAEILRLIDFGIASLEPSEVAPKLTQMGDRLGTYDYMPPEQFLGDAVDARADVYSAGATAYECLAGAVPFPGGHVGAAEAALLGRKPAPLPASVGAAALALDEVFARALARRPADRYGSAAELGRALAAAYGAPVGPLAMLNVAPDRTTAPSARDVRRFRRAPYVTPVRVLRESKPTIDGRSEDVSEGGLLLVVSSRIEDGEPVRVRFSLPMSGTVVTVSAVTRWVKSARTQAALGLEFVDLAPEAARDIRSFVELMGS